MKNQFQKKRKNKFNQDEYLNSYDFNVKLDGLIQPLLGKHSNNVIADLCIAKLYSVDKNLEYIDDNDVYDYIIKVLENYNNTYDSDNTSEEDIVEEKTEEVYYDPAREFSSNLNNKGTDITNTLKDFYK